MRIDCKQTLCIDCWILYNCHYSSRSAGTVTRPNMVLKISWIAPSLKFGLRRSWRNLSSDTQWIFLAYICSYPRIANWRGRPKNKEYITRTLQWQRTSKFLQLEQIFETHAKCWRSLKGKQEAATITEFLQWKRNTKIPKTFRLEGRWNIRGFFVLVGVVETKPREK